jgi:hypothetical protein
MNASEPPSSSTAGLMLRPACSPIAAPARSEPVSVTARTRESVINVETWVVESKAVR